MFLPVGDVPAMRWREGDPKTWRYYYDEEVPLAKLAKNQSD